MQNNNWNKVDEILQKVIDLEDFERREVLNSLEIDAEVRAEVENLLDFEKPAEDWSPLSAIDLSQELFEDTAEVALVGQKIGIYEIERELGYGGMGAVYLATRTDGKFEQRVALKLLKREMNTAALRRRFQNEREILASLEHPNIARLLNAGTTDDGVPYLVMEYVEGEPIDEFCTRNDLSLNQRLDLFRKVCTALILLIET